MGDDFYEEHGAMGQAYSYMHNEAKWKNVEAFKKNHRYIPEKKLEKIIEKMQDEGYYLQADKITVFGEREAIALYDGQKWNINIFPNKEYDDDRLTYCIDLKKLFDRYHMTYEINNLKEMKNIIKKHKRSSNNTLKKLI